MLLRPSDWPKGHGEDTNCEKGTLSAGKTLGSWVGMRLLELLELRLAGKASVS